MERRDQLTKIVSPLAKNETDANKFVRHLEELFDFIIHEKIGVDFTKAIGDNDYAGAIKVLADYYRRKSPPPLPELSGKGPYNEQDAENCISGIARSVNIDWTFPNGEIDFLFDPTEIKGPRNHEWLWQFNRHSQWMHIARAYTATGDERYAQVFEKQLLKWIAQTDIIDNWNGPGSAWRTIECGLRLLGSWPVAFDGFRKSPTLSDAALLLMIASMHRQSVHLTAHPTTRNWLMMESNGVYTFSSLFTELKDSAENKKIASSRLLAELEVQILPDGMHNELSPDYQSVVFGCAANFCSLARSLGAGNEIPAGFIKLIRDTVDAAILLSTPALTQPRTNDTFTIRTEVYTGRAEEILGSDPTYRYINSKRAEGTPPAGKTASVYLPYAGFAAMRSDWSADALYLCFDVGPLGTAHYHQDMLNINIFKGSRELIYDDGGGQYEISAAREYAVSAYGHNTVLVDGLGQFRKGPMMYTEPYDAGWISCDEFDYAAGEYRDTFGCEMTKPAVHKREVRFAKPDFFIVADTLTSADSQVHDYEAIFHLDTTKIIPVAGYRNSVMSCYGGEYEIAIIPLDDAAADVELCTVSAATEPQMQGWYNGRNESNLHKAITISRKVSGVKNFRFSTLFIPVRAGEDIPEIVNLGSGTYSISINGKNHIFDLSSLNK